MKIIKLRLKILPALKGIIRIEFIRNVITLTSGTVIAQLIPFLIIPLLTRLFSEELFGIFFIYSAITMVLAIIATLKYELAIVLPDNNEDSANLLVLSIIVTFFVSILVLILVILLFNPIIVLIGDRRIGNWLYFIPVSVFFLGTFQALSYWNNRQKNYKTISIGKVSRSLSSSSFHVALGLSVFQKLGLVPGMIFGQIISSVYMLFTTLRNFKHLFKNITMKKVWYMAKKYRDIPLYNSLIGVLNIISQQLPIFLLTRFYNLSNAGHYGLAYKVIGAPGAMVQQSFGEVFYQKASEKFNKNENFYEFVKKTYIGLIKIAIIPYLMIFLLTFCFGFIFGPEWEIAGKYARIIIPWIFLTFINSPIMYIITILNKQRILLIYHLFSLLFRFIAIYIGNSALNSITLFTLTSIVFNLILLTYTFIILSKNIARNKSSI